MSLGARFRPLWAILWRRPTFALRTRITITRWRAVLRLDARRGTLGLGLALDAFLGLLLFPLWTLFGFRARRALPRGLRPWGRGWGCRRTLARRVGLFTLARLCGPGLGLGAGLGLRGLARWRRGPLRRGFGSRGALHAPARCAVIVRSLPLDHANARFRRRAWGFALDGARFGRGRALQNRTRRACGKNFAPDRRFRRAGVRAARCETAFHRLG
ncbi:MAG TPA: hypothetical protein VFP00_12370, partial [Burkholderiales bacterium]|nr:hypothetical protein [Burkholderiales bacterium]